MEIFAAIITILSAILPPIVGHLAVKAMERRIDNEALTRRSLNELDIGINRMQ